MIKKILLPLCLSLFAMCNEDNGNNPTPPACTPITAAAEIIFPTGVETFKVGQDVTLQYKVNPAKVGSSVLLQVSVNAGKNWKNIKNTGESVPDGDVACMSYVWNVGSYEGNLYSNSPSVLFRVGKYGDPDNADLNAISKSFTVTP